MRRPMQTPLWISGMFGLGDGIFQRFVLRELVKTREVYLSTPWPQLYKGLDVRCVKGQTTLRTQLKNANRPTAWHTAPSNSERRNWHYVSRPGVTILQALCDDLRIAAPQVFDTTGPPVAPQQRSERYVVVKPPSIRNEWRADAREPRPEYVCRAVEALRPHFRVVSIADLDPGKEWALEPLPYADETYHRGELHVEQLMSLIAGASALIGGPGWMVPAAIAYRVPMFLIFGGWGQHNGPARIFDPRIDTSRIHQVLPDRFCMCGQRDHPCDKTITGLDKHLERFMVRVAAQQTVLVA